MASRESGTGSYVLELSGKRKGEPWTCLGCSTIHEWSESGLHGYRNYCNQDCARTWLGNKPAE